METGLHTKQISLQIRVLLFSLLNFPTFHLNPGVRCLVFCKKVSGLMAKISFYINTLGSAHLKFSG